MLIYHSNIEYSLIGGDCAQYSRIFPRGNIINLLLHSHSSVCNVHSKSA